MSKKKKFTIFDELLIQLNGSYVSKKYNTMKSLLENEYKPKLIDASYVCTEKESIHEIKAWFLCMQIIVQLNVENNSTNAAILFSELQLLEPSIKSLPAIQCIPLSALEIGLYLSRNGKQEEGQTYFKKKS